jgi:hypothetical protein
MEKHPLTLTTKTKSCSLAKAWDTPQVYLLRKGTFSWTTREGVVIFVEHMTTSHLFNCVRMIFNHTVPPHLRLREGGRYDMSAFSLTRRKEAIRCMLKELTHPNRTLEPYQLKQLKQMADTYARFARLQLK